MGKLHTYEGDFVQPPEIIQQIFRYVTLFLSFTVMDEGKKKANQKNKQKSRHSAFTFIGANPFWFYVSFFQLESVSTDMKTAGHTVFWQIWHVLLCWTIRVCVWLHSTDGRQSD